jgi:Family of unknown function (DUF6174)
VGRREPLAEPDAPLLGALKAVVLATLVAAVAGLAGPGAAGSAQGPPTATQSHPPDPSITNGSAQRKLNAARRKWNKHRPPSYAYRVRVSCFCNPESHTFVVRNGEPEDPPKAWRHFATAKRLFKLVQRAIDDRPDHLVVRYRKRNGLLKELSVDPEANAADEEYAYFVDRFHRLP